MNDKLTAMLEQVNGELTKCETEYMARRETILAKRVQIEKLLAWKPGEPVDVLALVNSHALASPVPTVADVLNNALPPASENGQRMILDTWSKQTYAKEWRRSKLIKAEFPNVNFAWLLAQGLIQAQGQGAGREYRVK